MGHTPCQPSTVNNGAHDDLRITKKALCPAACLGRKDTLSGHVVSTWPWCWPSRWETWAPVTNYEKRGHVSWVTSTGQHTMSWWVPGVAGSTIGKGVAGSM